MVWSEQASNRCVQWLKQGRGHNNALVFCGRVRPPSLGRHLHGHDALQPSYVVVQVWLKPPFVRAFRAFTSLNHWRPFRTTDFEWNRINNLAGLHGKLSGSAWLSPAHGTLVSYLRTSCTPCIFSEESPHELGASYCISSMLKYIVTSHLGRWKACKQGVRHDGEHHPPSMTCSHHSRLLLTHSLQSYDLMLTFDREVRWPFNDSLCHLNSWNLVGVHVAKTMVLREGTLFGQSLLAVSW